MARIQYTPAEIISFYQTSDKPEHFERFGPVAYQSKFKPLKEVAGDYEHKVGEKPSDQFASVLEDDTPKPQHHHQQHQAPQPPYVCPQPYGYSPGYYPQFMYPGGYGYPPGFSPDDSSFSSSQQFGVGPGSSEMDFPSVVGGGSPKGGSFIPRRTQSGFPGFSPEPIDHGFPPRSSSTEGNFRFPPQKDSRPSFAPRPIEDRYAQDHEMPGMGRGEQQMMFAPAPISQQYTFPGVVGAQQPHDISFAPRPIEPQFEHDFESVVGFEPQKVEQPTFAPKLLDEQYRDSPDFGPITTFPPSKKAEGPIPSFAPKPIEPSMDEGFPSVVDFGRKEDIDLCPKFAPQTLQETNFGAMFGFGNGKDYPIFAPQPLSDAEADDYPPASVPEESFPGVLDPAASQPMFAPQQVPSPTEFDPRKVGPPVAARQPIEPEPVTRQKAPVSFSAIQEEQAKSAALASAPAKRPQKAQMSFEAMMKEDEAAESKSHGLENFAPRLVSDNFYLMKTPIPDLSQAGRMHQGRRHW